MNLKQEISDFCRTKGVKLNTDLGQHFLVDDGALSTMIQTAHICSSDHIVEIGPGIGVLTRELASRAKSVISIEIDQHLIGFLKEFTCNPKNLEVIEGNALYVPFPKKPYKIVANIPYHITSPLLRHAFLESKVPPMSMTLLIQREVAEKICLPAEEPSDCAEHGMRAKRGNTKHETLLSILVGLFGTPTFIAKVPPGAFLPPPKVESAILHIQSFDAPLASPTVINEVFRLTRIAFSKKRKMLRNSIGEIEDGMDRLGKAGIDAERRPQTLSIEEWVRLSNL